MPGHLSFISRSIADLLDLIHPPILACQTTTVYANSMSPVSLCCFIRANLNAAFQGAVFSLSVFLFYPSVFWMNSKQFECHGNAVTFHCHICFRSWLLLFLADFCLRNNNLLWSSDIEWMILIKTFTKHFNHYQQVLQNGNYWDKTK